MEPAVDPVQLLQHTGWMKRLARSLVSEDQADDVVQQTWLTLLKSPPSRPATTAWLAAVVRRFAYRARRAERRRRRREKRVARQEATMMPTDPAILQRTELQKLIVSAVLDLEEPYRSTVILRYFEELRVKRIAEVQRVSAETVKTRLRRALGKLREKLDRENGGERRVWVALLGPLVCGPEPTTLTASTSREVSTTMAEPTKTWNVAVGIIGGGIAVSAKKATVATVVGVLLTAGLGGVLLWSPAEEGAKQEVSTIESSVDLTEVESDRVRTDATPSVALVPAVSGSPPHPENGEQHGSIRGRVRDRQGSVAAGVRVRAFRITKPDAFNEETALEGDTETTELGEFELTALPVGSYIVRAISSEHRPSEVRDLELTADALLDVELEVRAGLAITGVVIDPRGLPVVGAKVTSTRPPRNSDIGIPDLLQPRHDIVGWALEEIATTTDEKGRFRLARLPSGNRRIVARHPDWATSDLVIASGSEEAMIVMRAGAALRGRVVNASGEPVPGARLLVDRWLERGWHASYKTGVQVTTVEDGEFLLKHIAPGRFQLKIEADGFLSLVTGELQATEGGLLEEMEFVLADAVRASGLVVNATGQPVAETDVIASKVSGGRGYARTNTDDAGRFVLASLELGAEYDVRFEHPGFATRRLDSLLVDGEVDLGTVTLEEGSVLSGDVLDTAGNLLRHVEVALQRRRNESWRNATSQNVDGVFEFGGLDPGEYRVKASAAGFVPVMSERTPIEEGAIVSIQILLGGGVSVEGRVVDDRGNLVPGAQVSIQQGRTQTKAISDSEGRFLVRGLEEGEYLFDAHFRNLESRRFQRARTGDLLEIVVQRTARLSGTVRSQATEEPLRDFRVYLETKPVRSAGGGIHFKNPRGHYLLDDLEPGSHFLRILAPGHTFHEVSVELSSGDDRTLDVDLPSGRRVSGRLVDRSGHPVTGAGIFPVRLEEVGTPIRRLGGLVGTTGMGGRRYHQTYERAWAEEVRSDAEGRFTLSLAPGPVLLRVEYGESLFEDLPGFEVPEERGVELGEIRLQRGATVEGMMFDSLGEPLPGGTLSLDRLLEDGTEEPRGTIYFQIRKDGRFRKTGLRSGRYRIRLWENKTFERIVELGAGETRRLELQLPAGE